MPVCELTPLLAIFDEMNQEEPGVGNRHKEIKITRMSKYSVQYSTTVHVTVAVVASRNTTLDDGRRALSQVRDPRGCVNYDAGVLIASSPEKGKCVGALGGSHRASESVTHPNLFFFFHHHSRRPIV